MHNTAITQLRYNAIQTLELDEIIKGKRGRTWDGPFYYVTALNDFRKLHGREPAKLRVQKIS